MHTEGGEQLGLRVSPPLSGRSLEPPALRAPRSALPGVSALRCTLHGCTGARRVACSAHGVDGVGGLRGVSGQRTRNTNSGTARRARPSGECSE